MEKDTSVSELLRKREELLRLLQEEDEDVDYEVSEDGESGEEEDGGGVDDNGAKEEERTSQDKDTTDDAQPPSPKRARLNNVDDEISNSSLPENHWEGTNGACPYKASSNSASAFDV
ncbi:unnamed protein product [Cylicostephanus goldi]|uniref:Uncharacterized protein n=1 Tax=Cylicostephanus goldi TaxID=71465 RepID=A0A3P7MY69_CYLGO|nr:unnamed protein product [Cylicostephanus goldi]